MAPLIHDGYIVAVDTSENDRTKLRGKLVIAWHHDKGLIVSRLQAFDGTEVLVPENREYESRRTGSMSPLLSVPIAAGGSLRKSSGG